MSKIFEKIPESRQRKTTTTLQLIISGKGTKRNSNKNKYKYKNQQQQSGKEFLIWCWHANALFSDVCIYIYFKSYWFLGDKHAHKQQQMPLHTHTHSHRLAWQMCEGKRGQSVGWVKGEREWGVSGNTCHARCRNKKINNKMKPTKAKQQLLN